jgi:RNA ligase
MEHEDGRTIFNYSQINSPKHSPITQEARGLVLDRFNNYNLVARSFPRFFNLGEHRQYDNKLDWSNCVLQEKADGSLLLVYHHNGKWHVNTRGSFGSGKVGNTEYSWRDLFEQAVGQDIYGYLENNMTYVCELCTPYNQVVRYYDKPTAYLLTMFHQYEELPKEECELYYYQRRFARPSFFSATSADEAFEVVKAIESENKTHEGVVVRDINNHRVKVKSASYLRLHKLNNNGNLANDKTLIELIVANETDEVLTYYPNLRARVEHLALRLASVCLDANAAAADVAHILNKKELAARIVGTKYDSLIFDSRKYGKLPSQLLIEKTPEKILGYL